MLDFRNSLVNSALRKVLKRLHHPLHRKSLCRMVVNLLRRALLRAKARVSPLNEG
jgi:hypothetical protein